MIPAVPTDGGPSRRPLPGTTPVSSCSVGTSSSALAGSGRRSAGAPVFVNVDLIGGIAGDTTGIGSFSRCVEGIVSIKSRAIEPANSADLITIPHLFAVDAGTIEQGLKRIERAKPRCVEVLDRPVLAGGLLQNPEEVSFVLKTECRKRHI